jgi:hypothetical protein
MEKEANEEIGSSDSVEEVEEIQPTENSQQPKTRKVKQNIQCIQLPLQIQSNINFSIGSELIHRDTQEVS